MFLKAVKPAFCIGNQHGKVTGFLRNELKLEFLSSITGRALKAN